ncbi:MAG: tetratricopeptide repeat protein [Anaerolineales bacterium]
MLVIWDQQHLKALLRLPRYPKQLLDDEPWASWLTERRGVSAVRESLRLAPLQPPQLQLLELILSNPSTAPRKRAAVLHVSQITYFRYLKALVASLLEYLNYADAPAGYPATNLPRPVTPLIGVETTLQHILTVLADPQVRLVTIMGTGGIGKTRLAIQAARRILESDEDRCAFSDGIFWVDLAPLRAPDLILVEIAQVLHLTERSGYPTLELLQRELSERKLLLLLDNFEHLLAAAPLVAALLQRTARLKILVTSRAALNISGERRLPIPPLGLPGLDPLPAFERLSDYSAIQLFVQRARAIDESFALTPENALAVAQLCAEFDGLPLALEMAALRISHLSPQNMVTMLGQRLQLLAGGARDVDPRHQTLRNLIDWSYQLLDADVQRVFCRLAVFANGWTLEALEAVCVMKDESGKRRPERVEGMKDEEPNSQPSSLRHAQDDAFIFHPSSFILHPLDILATLIDQSIVSRQSGDTTSRFGMLETIREYAHEKLAASGEEPAIRQRHAAYYLSLVEAWTDENVEPSLPIAQLEYEYNNLRIALQWAIEQSQSELALDLGLALWHYWTKHGSPNEGQYWLARILDIKPPARSLKRIRVLIDAGQLLIYQNDFQQAQAIYEEMAALARQFNRRNDLGVALQGLGDIAQFWGDYPRARALYLESLALYREIEHTRGMGWALDRLGNLALEQGLLEEASAFFTRSLTIFETQDYQEGIAHSRSKLGLIAFEERRYADAVQLFEASLAYFRLMSPNWHYAWLIEYLGQAVLGLGDLSRAAGFFCQSLEIHFEGKSSLGIAYNLHGLASVALAEGQARRAVRLFSAVQRIFEHYPPPPPRRRKLDASVARSRDVLDPSDFAAIWREGQAMTLEQVVAEGLDIPR